MGEAVIAVDVGGTKIAAGLVDRDGRVVRRVVRPTLVESQAALLAVIESAARELVGEGAHAVGLGVPSTVDQRSGRVFSSVNIPLAGIDLRAHVSERLGLPVVIENDANAAALGEFRAGAGRDVASLVMLTLGTGCGGGVVIDGRLYRGWAELGHIVIDEDGLPCQGACTGRGHLEAYVTGLRAADLAREAFGAEADARRLVALARDGDGRARDLLAAIGRHLGTGIASLVNVFNPALVVVGGGFGTAAADFLFEPAHRVVRWQALAPAGERVRIVRAELGGDAGLLGAAFLAFDLLDGAAPG